MVYTPTFAFAQDVLAPDGFLIFPITERMKNGLRYLVRHAGQTMINSRNQSTLNYVNGLYLDEGTSFVF